ncbi:MAG: acetolactate synthase, partial [Planctomycetes bacterium]|nr:acetolactate synthase [Planctomycetota bacterium]
MDIEAFETAQASGAPRVRQFSVFLEDRVGQLLRLTRLFETTDVRIVGLSMVYSVDCAIIRLIVDDPDQGHELISGSRFPVCETELLAVSIPHGRKGLLSIWT